MNPGSEQRTPSGPETAAIDAGEVESDRADTDEADDFFADLMLGRDGVTEGVITSW